MTERARLLLWHLRREPGMTTGELARVVGAPVRATRSTLNRLRESGRVLGATVPTKTGHATVWRVPSLPPPGAHR